MSLLDQLGITSTSPEVQAAIDRYKSGEISFQAVLEQIDESNQPSGQQPPGGQQPSGQDGGRLLLLAALAAVAVGVVVR